MSGCPIDPKLASDAVKNDNDDDDDDDKDKEEEWTTVRKAQPRRLNNKRRANNLHRHPGGGGGGGGGPYSHIQPQNNRSLQHDANAIDNNGRRDILTVSLDEIQCALEQCHKELLTSEYWTTFKDTILTLSRDRTFGEIVCYGVGNFGTKRPSAPLWQLGFALSVRDLLMDHQSSNNMSNLPIYYFEPVATQQEITFLENLKDVHVISDNERGKRHASGGSTTLFFMPHCPLTLYTNVFYTNWDCLADIFIFGNSMTNYIRGEQTCWTVQPDELKHNALELLKVLMPFWEEQRLPISKKDILSQSQFFEQAFNDLCVLHFVKGISPPQRPRSYLAAEDNFGEVL
jgi:hypothetical protein